MNNSSLNNLNNGAINTNNFAANNNKHRGGKICLDNRLRHAEIEANHCLRDELYNTARGEAK